MLLIALLFLPVLHSCVSTSPKPLKRSDPLIGKIIDSATGQSVNFDDLIDQLAGYDVIYLSEKHDNPDQHQAQQKVIKALVSHLAPQQKVPSIGFEFFAMDHTPDLLNFIDAGQVKHSQKIETMIEKDLRMKLGWQRQSDTMWKYYYDLLKIAQHENLTAAGLDLSSTLKKRITKKGMDKITGLEKEMIFSTGLDDDTYQAYMSAIFKAVHCGMGHARMQSRLYDTWKARNDTMARSISQMHTHGKGPVIVILGGGHSEYNLGVIDRLKAVNADISQVNIALTEINISPAPLADYLFPLELDGFARVPRADFLWFFQRVSYEDPCIQFQESLKKMKNRHKKKK